MDMLFDPAIWISLVTLVVLEVVLGIDNLVFIAILADKLPPHQRDRARYIGLFLSLLMRIGLLATVSWLITLTQPLFSLGPVSFSGRDLILLVGGVFLTFKATVELHERLEGVTHTGSANRAYASFGLVVSQIVVLDAVFSLDSVITAVGMADHLEVMIVAVVIAMIVMVAASKPLTYFVSAHPTVVILCLSFLLMIGFSLMAEGVGFHIPKGYLYAAIGFSILIETFNQVSQRNVLKHEAKLPLRDRTAEAILRLMGGRKTLAASKEAENAAEETPVIESVFADEERMMISGVLSLAGRSVRRIMTPRSDISWVNCESSLDAIKQQLLDTPHSLFPVCRGSLDAVVGAVRAKELLVAIGEGKDICSYAGQFPAMFVSDHIDNMQLLHKLREAKGSLIIVIDEYGDVQGLVTPHDILEAIAGDFPDADEAPDISADGDGWLVKGTTDLYQLEQTIGDLSEARQDESFVTVAGLMLAQSGDLPALGDEVLINGFVFKVLKLDKHRVDLVRIVREPQTPQLKEEG